MNPSYGAILVAGVAAFIFGFLWYGPIFGKQWIAMMKIPQKEVDAMRAKGMGAMLPQMIASLVQQIVIAAVTATVLTLFGVTDSIGAALTAGLLWLGYIAMPMLNTVLWEQRKIDLYLFNVIYHLLSLKLIALIIFYLS